MGSLLRNSRTFHQLAVLPCPPMMNEGQLFECRLSHASPDAPDVVGLVPAIQHTSCELRNKRR